MKTRLTSIGLSVAVLTCSAAANPPTVEQCKANIDAMVARMNEGATDGPYRPNWKSLKTHGAQPEWFLDGKVGIYFHWGVYSAPALSVT